MSNASTSSADQPDDAPVPAETAQAAATGETAQRAGDPAPGQDAGSLERMARLRKRVREDGVDTETAARELGVDPIIAQLWLRLPDDLWPGAGAGATGAGSATAPAPADVPPPSIPQGGLRRVLTCRVPVPALERLRLSEGTVVEAAAHALEAGLAQPRPPVAPGGWRFARRPLAVPIPAETYRAVLQLAEASFRGDPRDAAGWLIARGAGLALPLPTPEELAGAPRTLGLPTTARPVPTPVRFVVPPRRRPETRAPLPADDSAPSGEELRRRREAAGLSQRDLAAASGLSRGLVAEIERGRRRHVLTRLKLSETLAAVERTKAAEAPAS
jgi:DNA-binding XRE family transcriptional regulator